ncbi:MBOAT family O-acyltransferase [Segatella buccae]|uniref:MBOAT family O-acyltransferase n=1 Tax=Segatella buccae TaxID=28126 RepID=UPI0022E2F088|nr:MBOAT family O-acyltransferase [Segatella buccae]
MEFLSIPFVVCLVLTFVLYYMRTGRRWQHGVLLLASCVFIGYYHLVYLLFALGITLLTFYAGLWLHRKRDTRLASWIFGGSVGALVGIWLVARYWSPLFPLGISFYTFQALSYLIEIYWDEEPERSLPDFTLYMLLFMKFLSGPIERGFDLLPQLKAGKAFSYDRVVDGMKVVAWGAFLKLVIADRIAPSLDGVFDAPRVASGMQLLTATMLYPIQLYADFAGYTCMAIGFGQMFGFRLSPNFNRPFLSQTTGELWRRWHISLSFWVRDYVFMPLSAELRNWGRWGVYATLLVTFVVIGVWHGAGWTFALYGLFQGVVVCYETMTGKWRTRMLGRLPHGVSALLMQLRTYLLFALSLLFFRVAKVEDTFYIYRHLLDGFNTSIKELRLGLTDFYWIVFAVAVVMMFAGEQLNGRFDLKAWSCSRPAWLRWSMYVGTVVLIFLFGAFGVENFIYIQF